MTREEQIVNYAKSFKWKGVGDEELKETLRLAIVTGAVWADRHPQELSSPSEDLEKYASRAGFDYVDDIEYKDPDHRWNDHDVEYAYRDGIINGANWQKAKMLEEAVEGKVVENYGCEKGEDGEWRGVITPTIRIEAADFSIGDKVKVIVVKEEQK